MRRLLLALACVAALILAGCTGDEDPSDPATADVEDPADAGLEGAFGEAGDCDALAEQAVVAYATVVDELGDAARDDTARVDAALDSFGGSGPDLAVRAEALDCEPERVDDAVCRALADLSPRGPAAEDFVATARQECPS